SSALEPSPAAEPAPLADLPATIDQMIAAMLRAGGAGMVGQEAQQASDRKARRDVPIGRAIVAADDAVPLIGGGGGIAVDHVALQVADRAIAVIARLLRGAAVAAHRHPSGIDDDPALFDLVADH